MKKSRFTETQIVGIITQHESGTKVSGICYIYGYNTHIHA